MHHRERCIDRWEGKNNVLDKLILVIVTSMRAFKWASVLLCMMMLEVPTAVGPHPDRPEDASRPALRGSAWNGTRSKRAQVELPDPIIAGYANWGQVLLLLRPSLCPLVVTLHFRRAPHDMPRGL